MAIKIHHGPPGSYKTSGAIMDDFIPAARAGRVVVTNVRGLDSAERVREVLGELPETFVLHHLPTTEHVNAAENRAYLAKWWHWAPKGCLLLIDEAQSIFPKAWRQKDLEALAFPGGIDAAVEAQRPHDWATAWDMHRHYGWDVVLTSPAISKIRGDIRTVAEGAYKHKNLKTVGVAGKYLEAFHLADASGTASNYLSVRSRKISKEVWGLYGSTATGEVRDSIVGVAFWRDPRILVLFSCIALALGIFAFLPSLDFSGGKARAGLVSSADGKGSGLPVPVASPSPGGVGSGSVVPGEPRQAVVRVKDERELRAAIWAEYQWRIWGLVSELGKSARVYLEGQDKQGRRVRVGGGILGGEGVSIRLSGKCQGVMEFAGSGRQVLTCRFADPGGDGGRGGPQLLDGLVARAEPGN